MRKGKGKKKPSSFMEGAKTAGKILVVLLSLPWFLFTYIVIIVLMLPTPVAFFVDKSPRKYLAKCVGSVNVCGILPALIALWQQGGGMMAAKGVLTDVWYWLYAYVAAGVGWALFTGVPKLIASYVSIKAQRRVQELRAKQERLLSEWGDGVATEVKKDEMAEGGAGDDAASAGAGGDGRPTLAPSGGGDVDMPSDVGPLPAFDAVGGKAPA